jgi:hypothetical protein
MGFRDAMNNAARRKRASQPGLVDQVRGMGRVVRRQGLTGAMNPFAIYSAGKEVKAERGGIGANSYFSKYDSKKDRIDLFVDKYGNPTTTYPHVHVVHNDSGGGIRVVASRGKGTRVHEVVLPTDADGRRIEAAVREAQRYL